MGRPSKSESSSKKHPVTSKEQGSTQAWPSGATKILFKAWATEKKKRFTSGAHFLTSEAWAEILKKVQKHYPNVTMYQCTRTMKTVTEKYRNAKKKNKTNAPFYSEIDEILGEQYGNGPAPDNNSDFDISFAKEPIVCLPIHIDDKFAEEINDNIGNGESEAGTSSNGEASTDPLLITHDGNDVQTHPEAMQDIAGQVRTILELVKELVRDKNSRCNCTCNCNKKGSS